MSIQSIGHTPAAQAAPVMPERDSGAVLRQAHQSQASSSSVSVDPLRAVGATQSAEKAQDARAEVERAAESVSRFVNNEGLEFSVDEDSGRTVVKLIDRETDEVLRQFPSEEILQIARALDKLQGLLLHQKA